MTQAQTTLEAGTILDGTETAKAIREELAKEIEGYLSRGLRRPGLAVLLIGENPPARFMSKTKCLLAKKPG